MDAIIKEGGMERERLGILVECWQTDAHSIISFRCVSRSTE